MSKFIENQPPYVIAVDPGNEKTGVAVLSLQRELIERAIVPTNEINAYILLLLSKYTQLAHIVCGNGTNHKHVYPVLEQIGNMHSITTSLIDESYTTEIARKLYWQYNPPKGLRRFIPTSALFPPEPVDDLTAFVIGQRYLDKVYK